MATHTILCGNCGTSAGGRPDPQSTQLVRCRKCGQADTYAAMIESATRFVMDHHARRSDPSADVPERQYRWVVAGLDG